MSLDNIQLSPFLVQNLYKKTLVDLKTVQPPPTQKNKDQISFLGQNAKNVVLLVNERDHPFASDDDLDLLVSILSACKLTLADVAIVNVGKHESLTYAQLVNYFNPVTMILFGVLPQDLSFPLHFPHYQLQQYSNQTFLCAPPLKMLATVTAEKKLLWNALQKHFFNK